MLEKEFLNRPKIDLHCHLDGSLVLGSMSEILGREVRKEEIQVSDNCTSLAEYLQKFDIPISCIQTEAGLKKSAKDFLLGLKKDNIKYVEARFAPFFSCGEGLSYKQIMESVLDGLKEASEETGILYQVIACNMRHLDEETNIRMMRECREFLGEGLCAIDLAGDEKSMPNALFGNLFEEAKKLDYSYTIHAGECGSVQCIKDAVEMGAKRIGHGIAMMGNKEVQKLLASKRIGVEMCPISNYQTKALQPEQIYPVREFAKVGVPVTINTDNRTVSNTSITREMEFLNERFGISDEEFYQYQMNAVDVAFCDDAMKHEIWKALK
jgi:adenosine deaminase